MFEGAMINQATQVAFIDEWKNDILFYEDAKRILQGIGFLERLSLL